MSLPIQQKALVLKEKFGDWALADVPVPQPGRDEVLVKIYSSALNPVDWKIQKDGVFLEEFPVILGSDIAGEVVKLGEGVSQVGLGDRVFLQGVISNNDQTGFQQSRPISPMMMPRRSPVTITAAYIGLYNVIPHGLGFDSLIKQENRGKYDGVPLVILGGSSAVGHFAIQLAKLSGFNPVITTASTKHEAFLKARGATHVLDRNVPLEAQLKAINAFPIKNVIDAISTAETQKQGFDILAPGGKQVLFLDPEPLWEEEGSKQGKTPVYVLGAKQFPQHIELLKELWNNFTGLLAGGDIKPHNVEVLPSGLGGIEAGLKRLEEGKISNTKLVSRPQETA
ncbi:GroES-like protein [Coprinellus micaceus]|uniref:GroES-like protein n=1 Tax=Coprinellus micaceus TaxID=71717 RepID=A0A4Y7TGZ3_COPMI|nr:GroES-like protein [Coprinellus micaceus]